MQIWTDRMFWNVVVEGMLVTSVVFLWAKSGRSPLVWAAWLALAMEAVRVELLHALGLAIATFTGRYRTTFSRLQREALAPGGD